MLTAFDENLMTSLHGDVTKVRRLESVTLHRYLSSSIRGVAVTSTYDLWSLTVSLGMAICYQLLSIRFLSSSINFFDRYIAGRLGTSVASSEENEGCLKSEVVWKISLRISDRITSIEVWLLTMPISTNEIQYVPYTDVRSSSWIGWETRKRQFLAIES